MSTIRQTLGWTDVPEEEDLSSDEPNPWWESKSSRNSKPACHLLVDDHLCRKFDKLHINLKQGYPTKTSDPSPLTKGQFLRVPPKARWYQMYQKPSTIAGNPDRVKMWYQDSCRINPTFQNLVKPSASSSPSSLSIPQDTLRKWERATKEQTVIINQAAGIMKCQQSKHAQLESDLDILFSDMKKYQFLESTVTALKAVSSAVNFCGRLTKSAAGCFRDLSEQVFVNHGNLILLRRDAFLDTVKAGITPDTLSKLRTSPVHTEWLFTEEAISKADAELKAADKPSSSRPQSQKSQNRYHPYKDQGRRDDRSNRDKPKSDAWKRYGKRNDNRNTGQPKSTVSKPARGQKYHK